MKLADKLDRYKIFESWKVGHIALFTLEVHALDCWQVVHTFNVEYLCGQLANLDQILL